MSSKNGISRRDFLKGAAAGAASLAVMGLGSGAALAEDAAPEAMNAAKSLEKWDFEIAPPPIPEEEIAEVIEDDIIVVGAGMSGLTTALSAAQNGALRLQPPHLPRRLQLCQEQQGHGGARHRAL